MAPLGYDLTENLHGYVYCQYSIISMASLITKKLFALCDFICQGKHIYFSENWENKHLLSTYALSLCSPILI